MSIISIGSERPGTSRTSHQPSRAGDFVTIALLILLTIPHSVWAWRVVAASRVPGGAAALTTVEDRLWCGYDGGDSLLTALNPADGEVVEHYPAPELHCRGLAYGDGSVWFLGAERLYQLDRQGQVQATQNAPIAGMRGLAAADGGLWTVDAGQGEPALVLFNLQGGVVRRIPINVSDVGDLFWDGTNFWLTDPPGGFIYCLDEQGAGVEIYPTPAHTPTGITTAGGFIYLIDAGDDLDGDVLYQISLEQAAAPRLLPGARLHDFGLINVGGSFVQNFSLFNVGGADLQIEQIAFVRGGRLFALGQVLLPLVIQAGRFAVVRISFSPDGYGNFRDTLIIQSNDPIEGVMRVVFQGVGIYAERMLGLAPDTLDFGVVRADPERDGSRHRDIHLINMGGNEIRVDLIRNGIPNIFRVEAPDLPLIIQPADSVPVRVWFTPHRGIGLLDTLFCRSDGIALYSLAYLRGRGDGAVYETGSVLWERELGDGRRTVGVAVMDDLNGDAVREVVAVEAGGSVVCLNGFASGEADAIWEQSFGGRPFLQGGLAGAESILGGIPLSGDVVGDVLLATGGNDRAAYALDGADGSLLWRRPADQVVAGSRILRLLVSPDCDGNGAFDPALLVGGEGMERVARLDGGSGHPVWIAEPHEAVGLEQIPDITGDGVGELIAFSAAGEVTLLSGADGWLIRSFELPQLGTLLPVGRLGERGEAWLIAAPDSGGIVGVDVISGRALWTVSDLPDGGRLERVGEMALYAEGETRLLAAGDEQGQVVIVGDLASGGELRVISDQGSSVTAVAWASPYGAIDFPTLFVGDFAGRVWAYDANHDTLLWMFDGAAVHSGAARSLFPFDDVDYGNTADLVALFDDGIVRCISSGGDVPLTSPAPAHLPHSPLFAALHPNPFNGKATITVDLRSPQGVEATAFDAAGRRLARRRYGVLDAGRHQLIFDAAEVESAGGVLFFRVTSGRESAVLRGVYLK